MNSQQEKILLQKNAELEKELAAKNFEIRIEAALELVRLKAMAMQKSEDLANAVAIIFEELDKLNMGMLRCGIGIINKENRTVDVWTTTISDKNVPVQISGGESMETHPLLQGAFNAWLKQEDFSYVLRGEDLNNFYKAQTEANFKLPDSQLLLTANEALQQYYFVATFKAGGLFAFRETPFPDEAKIIIKRFADVFNLTYTRFTDLKQAEALARKTQIEVALERVRSSSLAMHKSDELKDVVKVVFENLTSLGLEKIDAVNINILHEGSKEFDLWLAALGQNYTRNFRLPYFDHQIANDFFIALEQKEISYKKVYSYEVKNEYFKYMFENSDNKYLPEERKALILNGNAYAVSVALSDHSSIFIHNYDGEVLSDDDTEILIRFSKVFDQAYSRYLDLHKAELLIKEIIKQASLDRIRGQVASMRSAEDLQHIIPLMWQELSKLNIPFIRCGVFIMDEAKSIIHAYLSTPDGRSLGVLELRFNNDEVSTRTVEQWRKKEVFKHHWNKDEFTNWMQSLIAKRQIQDMQTFQGGELAPESLDLYGIPFIQGMLYVGCTEPLSTYELELVKSLAEAFSVAYARYEDFNKLEKTKQDLEATLTDLKSTQAQLIQSEKMASLGELTAGIAHEIQNPLNFVKNFSEVNTDLLLEMKEHINNGNINEVKAIATDVIDNQEKINHHGNRADAIVKGMLQHSRKSEGKKEPTEINKLADEYLRLAYHGLRAKDKSFNTDFKTDFDESIGEINIVPQDIGRVLLNLFNNAFYAVNEKKKTASDSYQPTVTVQTKKLNGKIEIVVKDNGNGIPQNIIDKIFQPFFTTKPTGQGTGLGLSLAYDIIKAHGGELKVETKQGEGSEFIIQLPKQVAVQVLSS
jgi:signal transduction histidine kinase